MKVKPPVRKKVSSVGDIVMLSWLYILYEGQATSKKEGQLSGGDCDAFQVKYTIKRPGHLSGRRPAQWGRL